MGGLQHMSEEEKAELGERISRLSKAPLSRIDKAISLGFIILDYMGEEFFKEIAQELRNHNSTAGRGRE